MKALKIAALSVLMLTLSFSAFSKNIVPKASQTDTTYYTHVAYHYDATANTLVFYLYMTVGNDWTASRVTVTTDITQYATCYYEGVSIFTYLTIESGTNYASYNATGLDYSQISYLPGSGYVSPTTYNGHSILLDPAIHSF